MGDATNLSARVMGKAEVGQVLATKALLDHVAGRFEIAPREPFHVKGKSLPVLAGVVGPPTGRRDLGSHDLPFVGRDRERALLDDALASARAGRGSVVVLSGEAGIGKSRLVAELLGAAEGVEVLTVEGGRYAAATPYFAVRAPLRALVGAGLGDDDATVADRLRAAVRRTELEVLPWVPLLGTILGVDLPDTPESAALGAEFRASVRHQQAARLLSRALPGPTVLLVDDGHWLDDATCDLLGHVAAQVAERPWLVCVSRRPGDEGWHPDASVEPVELALEPLSDEESARLLRIVADERPLVPSARSVLAARAAGNPLFLRELLDAVVDGNDGTDLGVLPDTLEEVISATVDQLDRADRELLRVCAVLGARFDVGTLAAMLGRPAEDVASQLARFGRFLAPDGPGTMRFLHGLVRDVAYEGLPFRRRRVLHGQAGDVLAPRLADHESLVDLLALHYRSAERHTEAWRHARAAGDRARRGAAPVEAARFYRWALDAVGHLPDVPAEDRADVGEALGDVLELDGRYDEAGRAFASARGVVEHDELRLVGLMKKEGWLRERSGRYSSALSWYTRALRRLDGQQGEPVAALRAQLTMSYGAARARQGKYAACLPYLYRAAAEAERLHDEPTLAHAYYLLDWALTDLGRPEAAEYREKALPIYERLGDLVGQATVLNNLGIDAYYEGRWDLSRELLERSRGVCRRSGNVTMDGTALNNIGEILSDQGRLDEAEAVFREALAIWRSVRFPVGLALCLSNLGRVASRAGRFDDAAELFADARRHFARIGADAFLVELDSREAETLIFRGDGEAALPIVREATARAEALGGIPAVQAMLDRLHGLALVQSGERQAGLARLLCSRGRASAAGADFELALTLHEWARLEQAVGSPAAAALEVSANTILAGLGVRSVPQVPLQGRVVALPAGRRAARAGERV